jgi:pyrroloquinoline quinone (PQQ) biosynthesis protein C
MSHENALTGTKLSSINRLVEEALAHRALRHPYLLKLESGDLPDVFGALKDFAHQYSAYSVNFRTYLEITISKLTHPEHQHWLRENLREENGHLELQELAVLEKMGIRKEWVQDIAHPLLFARFQYALGITEEWRANNPYCKEAVVWRDSLMSFLSTPDSAQAVGALGLGTENVVKYIYEPIVAAIQNHLDMSLEESVFFPLHSEVDDEHGLILQKIAADFIAESDYSYHQLRSGMLTALDLRATFWDTLLIRAQRMPPMPRPAR